MISPLVKGACPFTPVFSDKDRVLKVGKAGQNSNARYMSQHYNPRSSQSNLANSLLKDEDAVQRYSINKENVSAWIKQNTDRVVPRQPQLDRLA